ncbi:iron ABC transporter permease [Arthrobacter sp. MYb224]|uniref:iron-enterobactin ABC transporter permease n=1 Tax=Arthrobacter sp. MYb224 TaxID=1848600 RepID=UPI000CFCA77A|nr:iron-enterobactin ABC transporter permease [Arthrobacter sp. MYb224]PQZ98160.1 iron ABC transporter permease [Arthrobacter sp. MYb224]
MTTTGNTLASAQRVDFGPGHTVLSSPGGRFSLRVQRRSIIVCAIFIALGLVLALWALATGEITFSATELLRALLGTGSSSSELVVLSWRLPRVVMALALGAALGISGAIFQSLTRNPLGSPDIIGFNTGAYTGALAVIFLAGGGYFQIAAGALLGGLLTAALVYLLAYRRGSQGFRLIIVGIAFSAILASLNTWLILRAGLEEAMSAAVWGAGSLNAMGWEHAQPALLAVTVFFIAAAMLAPRMHMLEMGDDAASALGIRVEPARLLLMVVGVGFTALATAAAGPISFIALAAPQVARHLTRSAGVRMGSSAILGAVLLLFSDLMAQRLVPETALPVGVVTVSVGGIYLIWLLLREAKRS